MNINSILSNLPTYDDALKNHKNLPYTMLQTVSGKSGSGKNTFSIERAINSRVFTL